MRQLVWVERAAMTERVSREAAFAATSLGGGGDWDLTRARVLDNPKVKAGIAHWRDGVPWEDTGIYKFTMKLISRHGSHDGMSTLEDVVARYRYLDVIWDQVCSEGRLRPMSELDPTNVTERGALAVGVGRGGDVVWVADGSHRLAMGWAAEVDALPARLVVVHPDAPGMPDATQPRPAS